MPRKLANRRQKPFSQNKGSRHRRSAAALLRSDPRVACGRPHYKRDPIADINYALSVLGADSIEQLEESVGRYIIENGLDQPLPPSAQVQDQSRKAFEHFVGYLAVDQLQSQNVISPTPAQVEAAQEETRHSIRSGSFAQLNDRSIWLKYLHAYALAGRGNITAETLSRAFVYRQSDNDQDAGPMDPTPNQDEVSMVTGLQQPPPGSSPLTLRTLEKRLKDITRHLGILQVQHDPGLRDDVIRMIRHLASQRGFYPT